MGWTGIGLVAPSKLPRTRFTLLLRLLGAGSTLKNALEDLAKLPKDAPERRFLARALSQARFAMSAVETGKLTNEELIMWRGQAEFEAYERGLVEKGIQLGVQQGLQQGVAQGLQLGVEQGLQLGVEQGLQLGVQQGHQQTTTQITARLLTKRLARPLSEVELSLIRERISFQQSDAIADMLIDATVEELEAWLRGLAQ